MSEESRILAAMHDITISIIPDPDASMDSVNSVLSDRNLHLHHLMQLAADGRCTQEWHYPEDAGSYFTFRLPDISAMFKVWSPNHHIYPREQAELVDDADQDELDDEASLVPTDLAGSD